MIMDSTIRELRHAARLLARTPAVTTLVLAILGLALAARGMAASRFLITPT